MGKLREKYGDITVLTLEQIIDEIMSSKLAQPRILIGQTTDEHDITETTRQLMTKLLTSVSVCLRVCVCVCLCLCVEHFILLFIHSLH